MPQTQTFNLSQQCRVPFLFYEDRSNSTFAGPCDWSMTLDCPFLPAVGTEFELPDTERLGEFPVPPSKFRKWRVAALLHQIMGSGIEGKLPEFMTRVVCFPAETQA